MAERQARGGTRQVQLAYAVDRLRASKLAHAYEILVPARAYALREVEERTAVADVCRQLGVSEATFYIWKKKYGHLGVTELRELRQLRTKTAG